MDPTGLQDEPLRPNLTSFGQGDWTRLGSPFTKGDMLSKVQNYLGELKSSVDTYVNKANAASQKAGGKAQWSADYSNWLKSSKDFDNPQNIATTEFTIQSNAVMNANGTVEAFNMNLHIGLTANSSVLIYLTNIKNE